jgi:N-acetyl-gamma-glutamyl-phosphate reductase
MIKVGIVGCDNLQAAELVRILINHPDVELMWVIDAPRAGMRLDDIVPGIVGETDLTVQAESRLDGIDVLYWCGSRSEAEAYFARLDIPEDLKIIDLSGSHNLDHGEDRPWKYGLSEMQRRVLVHDARLVTVPGNVATASLLAVMPMARNLLLNSPLELHVALGVSALGDADVDLDDLARNQRQEIVMALEQCQSSFGQPVTLTVTRLAERRTLAVAARFKCGVAGEMIRQLYAQYYDDHNFVFMVDRPIVTADIENTNKCLIHIDKDEARGLLTIHAVMDALLKGGAGTAVHAMNLLFGLHEKVGLAFKATGC